MGQSDIQVSNLTPPLKKTSPIVEMAAMNTGRSNGKITIQTLKKLTKLGTSTPMGTSRMKRMLFTLQPLLDVPIIVAEPHFVRKYPQLQAPRRVCNKILSLHNRNAYWSH